MRVRAIAALTLCFLAAAARTYPATPSVRLKVAVAEFQVKGETAFKDAAVIVPEWLIGALAKTGAFEVLERVLLDKVLEEQGLALSGLIGGQGPRAGALVGADAVVAGSVISWAGSLSVTVRLIDATTGEVMRSATLEGVSTQELPGRMDDVARVLAGQMPQGSLAGRAASGQKAKEYAISVVKATRRDGAVRVVIDRGLEDSVARKMVYRILLPVYGESEVTGERVRVGMRSAGFTTIDYVEPQFAAGDLVVEFGASVDLDALVDEAVAVPTMPFGMGLEFATMNLGGEFGYVYYTSAGILGILFGYEAASDLAKTLGGMTMAFTWTVPVVGSYLSDTTIGPGLGASYLMTFDYPYMGEELSLTSLGLVAYLDAAFGGFFVRGGARAEYSFGSAYVSYLEDGSLVASMMVVEPFVSVGYRVRILR